jgi:hypothetical protein
MPLIWGEMGRGIFLLEGLDRANHVELPHEFRAAGQRSAAINSGKPTLPLDRYGLLFVPLLR